MSYLGSMVPPYLPYNAKLAAFWVAGVADDINSASFRHGMDCLPRSSFPRASRIAVTNEMAIFGCLST